MVSVVAFDKPLNCLDERARTAEMTKLIQAVDEFFEYSGKLSFQLPLYRIYPTKMWKKFVIAADIVYKYR